MPTPRLRAALLAPLIVLCLSGCGSWNRMLAYSQVARTPNIPAGLQDKIDGGYKGVVTLVSSQSPACPGNSVGTIEIGDQKLYFAYRPDVIFVAPIRPDGSLYAVSGASTLEGSIDGGRLVFVVRTPVCASQYNMNWTL